MPTIRILHASDLHISQHKNMVSPIDQFARLRGMGSLKPSELVAWAAGAFKAFRNKMTASSYEPDVLKHLALFIYDNARKKRVDGNQVDDKGADKIDAVLLSGDLATTGAKADIDKVEDFLYSPGLNPYPYENARHEATIGEVLTPVWYLPGNHDRFEPNKGWITSHGLAFPRFFDPGGTEFDRLVDFTTTPAMYLGAVPDWSSGAVPLRVVVLAADFSLRQLGDHDGLYGWLAQGRIYDSILDELASNTDDQIAKHKDLGHGLFAILWVVHFPPGFPHISSTNRLLDEEKIVERAKDLGVAAILAGHTHEQVHYRKPGMNFDVLCCGTSSQHVPPNTSGRNRFQIIEIKSDYSTDVEIRLENYQYMRASQDPVPISNFYLET